MLPTIIQLPLRAQSVPVATWKNPAAGQDPQLQTVPLVPGQPGPFLQPFLVMYGPPQKLEMAKCRIPSCFCLQLLEGLPREWTSAPCLKAPDKSGPQSLPTLLGPPFGKEVPPLSSNNSLRDSDQYPTNAATCKPKEK